MTSLEAISIKLQEEKDKRIETILKVSGSSAIVKNEYGVNIVDENAASSLVFKGLTKDKYDTEELIKAVDVTVIELLPNIPATNLDLVPRPVYNAELTTSLDLRKQVAALNVTVATLNTTISDLQAQVQFEINNRLSIEQTNDLLVNQIETLTSTIEDFASQIATSLQKSVDESILRASLQSQKTGFKAQIEALIQQINSLNAIIEGLQAQLGAVRQQKDLETTAQSQGGTIINKIVTTNFTAKGSANDPVMSYKIKNARDDAKEWVNGKNLKITNNDLEPVTIKISATWDRNQRWFSIPKTDFKITAGSTEEIDFVATPQNTSYGKRDNTTFYKAALTITVQRADGTSETKSFPTALKIAHPKSYGGF
jgi:hypothetical protein